ncbi:MAG: hypothetical protein LBK95_01100 [Bifidobacteriaceae bacterium]|jgi:hypothetical protein|nr:hypothetical protein [Bifidobacteriaceae bacterium]
MGANQSFSPAFGNRPAKLVGRDDVVSDFVKGLAGAPGHPNRASLCLGLRGMGKTALLLELAEQARQAGFVPAKATTGPDLLAELLEAIQVNGSKHLVKPRKVKSVSAGALGFSAGLAFTDEVEGKYGFRTKLGLLCDELAKHGLGVVLLVDEVTATAPDLRRLATAYQELVGEGKNIAIAMAGLPAAISTVVNEETLTFLNRARKVELGAIPVREVSAYYHRTFRGIGKQIDAALLEQAAAATLGYPYLLQLVGYYLLEYAGDDAVISASTVTLALSAARSALADTVFLPSLHPLSPRDRAFLEAMAQDDGFSDIAGVQRRLGVSASSAQQTRARLIAHGPIASVGRGRLEIQIPYLREYLAGTL